MIKVKSFFKIIQQLGKILNRNQKKSSISVFIVIGLGSIVELLGVSAIFPFLEILMSLDNVNEKWYVRLIQDVLGINGERELLIAIGCSIILIYILKNIFMLFVAFMQAHYSARIQHELSTSILDAYMKKTYLYFTENNSADIIRGINSDVSGVHSIIQSLFVITSSMLTSIMIVVFLMSTDVFLAVGLLLVALFTFVFIILVVKTPMKRMGIEQREANSACHKNAVQAVMGIKEITVLRRREYFVDIFRKSSDIRRKAIANFSFIISAPDRIIEGFCISGLMGIVCWRVMIGDNLTEFIPVLGTFAVAAFKILPCISKISSNLSSIIFFRPTVEGVYDALNDLSNVEHIFELDCQEDKLFDSININGVSWKYPNGKKEVLKDINLKIKRGEAIALIGPSGSGKTTLADIILGLYSPQTGMVLLDNQDIAEMPKKWANLIGYVPQTTFLVDDTIRNNIVFGKEYVDEKRIWEVLEMAQMKEFVESLPEGIDTFVGERGVRFSGGQQQRIAVARALYHDPKILVLDEATSSLDSETEDALVDAINALHGEKTLIVVAHRLTTIRNCDKIYEISGGKAILRNKEEVIKN